jgi:hypothetical protein
VLHGYKAEREIYSRSVQLLQPSLHYNPTQKTTLYLNMHLTTITAILAAALSASATPMVSRQAPGSVTGIFYSDNSNCNGVPNGDTYTFVQDTTGVCHDLAEPLPITDTDFVNNTLTRPSRQLFLYRRIKLICHLVDFYSVSCAELAPGSQYNVFHIVPGYKAPPANGPTDCKHQLIRSYITV